MFCINTRVDEASRCSFAELFRFIRQRDLDDSRDVPRRRLNTDGVRCNQLRNEDSSKRETNYFLHFAYLGKNIVGLSESCCEILHHCE